jgi:hypothetical protein
VTAVRAASGRAGHSPDRRPHRSRRERVHTGRGSTADARPNAKCGGRRAAYGGMRDRDAPRTRASASTRAGVTEAGSGFFQRMDWSGSGMSKPSASTVPPRAHTCVGPEGFEPSLPGGCFGWCSAGTHRPDAQRSEIARAEVHRGVRSPRGPRKQCERAAARNRTVSCENLVCSSDGNERAAGNYAAAARH